MDGSYQHHFKGKYQVTEQYLWYDTIMLRNKQNII